MPMRATFLGMSQLVALACAAIFAGACDDDSSKQAAKAEAGGGATASATATASAAPEPPRAPDIVVTDTNVSVGQDRVATAEQALADKVAVFVTGRPMVEGQVVTMVAMRAAKPSPVAAVVAALRKAKAAGAIVKSESREGATETLSLAFTTQVADCAVVAWIAKDASIDVWTAGGSVAKRQARGLAGPDITLGLELVRAAWSGCTSSQILVGAEDTMQWGLVFDLATKALASPGSRANSAILVTNVVPGRKVTLE
jgi:hypothetical protein